MPLALSITPSGRIVVEDEENGLPAEGADRIRNAFTESMGSGLLHLGLVEVTTALTPTPAYFRELGRRYLARVCATPAIESLRPSIVIEPAGDELAHLLAIAPPMRGGEYLSLELLERLWREVGEALEGRLRAWEGTVEEFLRHGNPAWNLVGRVHLHLAENKQDPGRPFAFVATYSTRLSAAGRPQHRPLGSAVRESAEADASHSAVAEQTPSSQPLPACVFLRVSSRRRSDAG